MGDWGVAARKLDVSSVRKGKHKNTWKLNMEPVNKTDPENNETNTAATQHCENGEEDEEKSSASHSQPSGAAAKQQQHCQPARKHLKVVLPRINTLDQSLCQEMSEASDRPRGRVQTARKSLRNTSGKESQVTETCNAQHLEPKKHREEAKVHPKILNFRCSLCKSDVRFSPNDFLKHYQVEHEGYTPIYPCNMCNYSTYDFQILQQHRMTHRDTMVRCDVCNDGVHYPLLQLTRHFNIEHSVNGHFSCEKCKFSTKDVGTFVQHIHRHNEIQYKCDRCSHVSYSKGEFQRHLVVHTCPFPFYCQFCDYGAIRKDYILKHMTALHSDQIEKKCKWKENGDGTKKLANTSTGLMPLLPRKAIGTSREANWETKALHSLRRGILDECGRLSSPEQTLQETQHFLERTVGNEKDNVQRLVTKKNDQHHTRPVSLPLPTPSQLERVLNSNGGFIKTGINESSLLKVKNKIPIPPNCTTKFMGFKMVDGKRHLVLKVIPASKADSSTPKLQSSSESDANSHLQEKNPEKTVQQIGVQNEEVQGNSYPTAENCESAASLSGSLSGCLEILESGSTPGNLTVNVVSDHAKNEVQAPSQSFSSEVCTDMDATVQAGNNTCSGSDISAQENDQLSSASLLLNETEQEQERVLSKHKQSSEGSLENIVKENENKPLQNFPSQEVFSFHNYSKDIGRASSEFSETAPDADENEDEDESSELQKLHYDDDDDDDDDDDFQDRKKLLAGNTKAGDLVPQVCDVNNEVIIEDVEQESTNAEMSSVENELENEKEIDKAIPTAEENSEQHADALDETPDDVDSPLMPKMTSVFPFQSKSDASHSDLNVNHHPEQELETEKKKSDDLARDVSEGESCCGNKSTPRNYVLGQILEKHSDAIINQQLVKERMCTSSQGPLNLSPGTMRILQPSNLTEGNKPVLLQSPQNGLLLPLQLGSQSGLQVLTGVSVPQINVTSVHTGNKQPDKQTGLSFTISNGRIGSVTKIVGDGSSLLLGRRAANVDGNNVLSTSGLQIGNSVSPNTGHILINGMPLQGSLILSNSIPSLAGEKSTNLPTCFFIKKPPPEGMYISGHNSSSVGQCSQVQQTSLATPVTINPIGNPTVLSGGRQAFLVKRITPVKQSILLNSQMEGRLDQDSPVKKGGDGTQNFLLKIVRRPADKKPVGSSGDPLKREFSAFTADESRAVLRTVTQVPQQIFLASDALQSPYILMSSNQSFANCSMSSISSGSLNDSTSTSMSTVAQLFRGSSLANVQASGTEVNKSAVISKSSKFRKDCPRPKQIFPKANRKRQRKLTPEEDCEEPPKAKRALNTKWKENEKDEHIMQNTSRTVPKDIERTLRLAPFCPSQLIKCPRRNQPVVVLNHPDADVPEVVNVMRTINKFKGHVLKVALSQRTIDALSELECDSHPQATSQHLQSIRGRKVKPVSPVKERYILKLKLKKTSRNKYKVVNSTSNNSEKSTFSCWFCGRLFTNQEDWIGHGQRHLMEATRDWNTLF
ncbi:zinc finger protein 518A-like isoform X1 [Acipenser ruthenus]|uniref:zinc finger protein 518A-like isoform X1 n=2 Tax=Acipenser ruthenus TaxID=7906 RepID=UPI0027428690|nr:zinc finger protein 518A-like isoform X1 [Acipenser ruthenus]